MIQYRLEFRIYNTEPHEGRRAFGPIYEDKAELDVASLRSHNEYSALCTLFHILKSQLLREGSTIEERQALGNVLTPTPAPPIDVDQVNLELDSHGFPVEEIGNEP